MLGLDHGVAPEIPLDPGHGPGGRLRRGEQRTAAVLVERAPTTVQALQTEYVRVLGSFTSLELVIKF